jgi:hypothetical protein
MGFFAATNSEAIWPCERYPVYGRAGLPMSRSPNRDDRNVRKRREPGRFHSFAENGDVLGLADETHPFVDGPERLRGRIAALERDRRGYEDVARYDQSH